MGGKVSTTENEDMANFTKALDNCFIGPGV